MNEQPLADGAPQVEVRGQALEEAEGGASCLWQGPPEACAVVIFGASGDLTGRKLVPALYNLFVSGGLPSRFLILGSARRTWSDDEFRSRMKAAILAAPGCDPRSWDDFAACLHYHSLTYDQPGDYTMLAARLEALEASHGTGGRRVFNLAVPPDIYQTVAVNLGRAGLGRQDRGWSRLVVEKPFGRDLASARALNQALAAHFQEEQVYRIDHYLAKETVQNILMLRFANAIFEPVWNRNYIDHVSIVSSETLGVEHRAGYYERAGVLRDMFQNHMLQLLSLAAQEPPSVFAAERVRDEKVKLFRSLRPFDLEEMDAGLVLGQYGAGESQSKAVPAYRAEPGVAVGSLTPTFALMRVFVDNWRWQGVPFYLLSGKRMKSKLTRLVIHFKEVPHWLMRQALGEHITANRLTLGIHPDESISLTIQTKNPGARLCLRTVRMLFDYQQGYQGPRLEAYEKALLDCMLGDQLLFWRQDGLELTWEFLDPVLELCETCGNRAERLKPYPAGTWGPPEATALMAGRPLPWD
jgi:glucose-6-phosphate 1-dehydrogenase